MLVDSHCHLDRLDLTQRAGGLDKVISDAQNRGISHLLTVAIDMDSSRSLIDITSKYPNVYSSVGAHPLQDTNPPIPAVEDIVILAQAPKVVAVGETGLDNHYGADSYEWQRESFVNHLIAAQEVSKPLIIHTREARKETMDLLNQYSLERAGVMHCFTETWEMAKAALDLGFYISFSGIVTFKNADELRQVVAKVPLDRLLIETDSPWLAPVPYRGKQNEPQYVYEVAQCVANIKKIDLETLAKATTDNFFELFQPSNC